MTDRPDLPEEDNGGILLLILVVLLIVDILVTAALIAYIVMFGGASIPTPGLNNDPSQAQTSQTQGSGGTTTNETARTAYWVSDGKIYHFSTDCPSLDGSSDIQTGTLQNALDAGMTDPCSSCANGS